MPRGDAAAAESRGDDPSTEQEQLIAAHEQAHGPLPHRILGELRTGTKAGRAAGARAAGTLGTAAEALRLEVVRTSLGGPRSLIGHVLGMRLLIPAEGIHGPRESPALLYVFGDAVGIRPSDDAPMSAVPLYGLHIVMPHVAVARWVYKAGRTAHANLDLAKEESEFVAHLAEWTIDDFADADDKLRAVKASEVTETVHLYQHFGSVHLDVAIPGGPAVRLKSALPESAEAYVSVWELFDEVHWAGGLAMHAPTAEHEEPPPT